VEISLRLLTLRVDAQPIGYQSEKGIEMTTSSSTMKLHVAATIAALLMVSLLVVRASSAAFSAQTDNPSNSWATGAVALSDDDGGGAGSAMFDVTGMIPGDTITKCIAVTYAGSADPSPVKLFSTVTDNGLADHLDVTVREGDGGGYGSCAGFSATATIATAVTLTTFAGYSDYASGIGTWDPTATGQTKTYEFTVTLGADTPDTAQGADAQAGFTWEITS
jgi:hypothetical protein